MPKVGTPKLTVRAEGWRYERLARRMGRWSCVCRGCPRICTVSIAWWVCWRDRATRGRGGPARAGAQPDHGGRNVRLAGSRCGCAGGCRPFWRSRFRVDRSFDGGVPRAGGREPPSGPGQPSGADRRGRPTGAVHPRPDCQVDRPLGFRSPVRRGVLAVGSNRHLDPALGSDVGGALHPGVGTGRRRSAGEDRCNGHRRGRCVRRRTGSVCALAGCPGSSLLVRAQSPCAKARA